MDFGEMKEWALMPQAEKFLELIDAEVVRIVGTGSTPGNLPLTFSENLGALQRQIGVAEGLRTVRKLLTELRSWSPDDKA